MRRPTRPGRAADDRRAAHADDRYYAGAWALAHMLMASPGRYRGRFAGFLDALAHGSAVAVAREQGLRRRSIPGALERDFRAYLQRQEYPVFLVKAYAARPAERPLSGADDVRGRGAPALGAARRLERRVRRAAAPATSTRPWPRTPRRPRSTSGARATSSEEGSSVRPRGRLAAALSVKPSRPALPPRPAPARAGQGGRAGEALRVLSDRLARPRGDPDRARRGCPRSCPAEERGRGASLRRARGQARPGVLALLRHVRAPPVREGPLRRGGGGRGARDRAEARGLPRREPGEAPALVPGGRREGRRHAGGGAADRGAVARRPDPVRCAGGCGQATDCARVLVEEERTRGVRSAGKGSATLPWGLGGPLIFCRSEARMAGARRA